MRYDYLYRMNSIFPASYSTLSTTALANHIAEKYAFKAVQCRFMLRGVGDTYLVETNDSKFILRVYSSAHRSESQISAEVDLLLALKDAQVPVAYPIVDISGTAIQVFNAVEGKRCAVLFSYAPGTALTVLNDNQLTNLGRQMARFHNVSATIKSDGKRWQIDVNSTLFEPLALLKNAFAEEPNSYQWLQEAAKGVAKKLATLNTAVFSTGYCHFDMLPKNFHFEGDSVIFFDFDFMGHGWLVNDLMTFQQQLYLDVHFDRVPQEAADRAFALVVAGYREFRDISDEELAAIPYLSLSFWVFYSGFHATHDQFYLFIQTAHLKNRFRFVRHFIEKHWDKQYLPE